MPNQFFSPEGDIENYFVTEYWLIDQYIGDQLWTWGTGSSGILGNAVTSGNISTPVTTFTGGTDWKQVSAGYRHTAAIKTDGTLWAWGTGSFGRLGNAVTSGNISTPVTTFTGGTNWKQVSAGGSGFHTTAIKTDGTLWTWGYGFSGRLGTNDQINRSTPVTTFTGGTDWKQVSAGGSHTTAIKTDGTLWTWGNGSSGQLGRFSFSTSFGTPVTTFAGGTNWADTATTNPEDLYTLSAGSNFTAAIKTDGTLWVWGNGTVGKLGNASETNTSTPVTTFTGGTNWKQVSAGTIHTAAIKTDGTLWTWGSNGQLGNAELFGNISTPITTFAGGTDWKQVSAGNIHTVAIKTDGTLWTWGYGGSGRLGNGVTTGNISTPITTFTGGTDWKQVSVGYSHTAAIKTDGTLWTWGSGNAGRLGNAVTTDVSTPVTTFAGGTNWKQVSGGQFHTAAIKTDGTLWTWGNGNNGRLGNADTTLRSTPITTFTGGTDWKQVDGGDSHTAAVKTDGTLWTWGRGDNGRLGNATITLTNSTPVTTFAGGTNWKQVSAGGSHTIALRDDGVNKELFVWGNNLNLQLGNNLLSADYIPNQTFLQNTTNWKQVSSGYRHTSAIKTDGTLWAWGNGLNGRLGNASETNTSTPVTTFTGGTDWKQISAGGLHTAAIKTDGTLWTWGSGSSGQLGRFSIGTTKITPVTTFAGGTNWADTATTNPEDLYTLSAGGSHTAAIKTDGTLWTWGNGTYGRLGNADTTDRSTPITTFTGGTDWKQVDGGYSHTAAIKTDGTLWTWGFGNSGRLGNATVSLINSTPVTTFAGGTDWKQVSAGDRHTTAIKTDGTLWTWGSGTYGRLGNADTTLRSTPITTFTGGTDWKQVSAGGNHITAIKTDGTLWAWGNGLNGRLGNAVTTDISTPVTTFTGGTDWKQVSAGDRHTTAIKTDGTLWTWGEGSYGRLGNADTTLRSTPITTFTGGTDWKQVNAGATHTAAIKTDGTLWTWGYGFFGRLGNASETNTSTPVTTFAGGTNWKQVSAGSLHTVALRDDGVNKELFTWGNNFRQQLGDANLPSDYIPNQTFLQNTTNWKQVSGGTFHTTAIKTDGTLWTWGVGTFGRLGNAETTGTISTPVTTFTGGTNWKQVSGGNAHTAAVQSGISADLPLS